MSDVLRYLAPGDFLQRLVAILPGTGRIDLASFEALVVRDCVIADDGGPHPELVVWVQRILDRDAGDAVAVPVRPVPGRGPVGAEVMR